MSLLAGFRFEVVVEAEDGHDESEAEGVVEFESPLDLRLLVGEEVWATMRKNLRKAKSVCSS